MASTADVDTPMKRPNWKFRHPGTRPKRPASRSPALEPLEHRQLLSVAVAEIDSTAPADGQALLGSPQQFVINFDPGMVNEIDNLLSGLFGTTPAQTFPVIVALDNNTQGYSDEFSIDRVDAGGDATPIMGGNSSTPLQASIATTTDDDGTTTQSQMTITPAAGAPPLTPGTYQIDVEPGSFLDAAFSFIDPSPAWTSSQPFPIAQFTILGQGMTLGDAINLGDIGSTTRSVSGFIDPQGSQTQVALYRITLPEGHPWQLDTQVFTQTIGSPLPAALALFDGDGNVLATSASGQGPDSDQAGPLIVQDLAPGTYYLGISASGNLPGWTGGYDLKAGTPGTAGFDEADGAFLLDAIATPLPSSTTLTSGSLDYEDPLETSPTGLDLTFSGPIDRSLFQPDQQETALEVVDASGEVWPMTAMNYQTSTNTLSFIFDEPLPAGSYSLIDPAQGGLTDAVGQPIVVPAGNPSGVLASWTVAPAAMPSDPGNLGVVWPGPVNVTWDSAIARTTELSPGQEADYRFVAIYPGLYIVQTQSSGDPIDLAVTGADGTTEFAKSDLTGLNQSLVYLDVGVYSLRMTSAGANAIVVRWTLHPPPVDWDSLPLNGVGQTAALSLTLDVPMADSQGVLSTNFLAANTPSTAATYGSISPSSGGNSGAGASLSTFTASPIPAGLLVSMNSGLMGLPGTNSQDVGAVGPMASGASASLADRVRGLLPGITYVSRSSSETRAANGDTPEVTVSTTDTPNAVSEAVGRPDPEAAGARNDGRALARADRLVRIAAWVEDVLGLTSGKEPDARAGVDRRAIAVAAADRGETADLPPVLTRTGPNSTRRNTGESVAQADIRAPLGLIMAAAVAYRLRRPIETWWRRRASNLPVTPRHPHPHRPFRGPHSRPLHAATTLRPGMPRTPY